jgi:pimeloyl-ACP methyl ester carboxylesterase
MTNRIKTLVPVVLALLIGIAPRLWAENPPTANPPVAKPPREVIGGHWLATLKVQGIRLRLVATIRAQPDGSLKGTLNSQDQDGMEYPLDEVSLQERRIRLVLKISGLVYEGTLNAAGTNIAGQLKQRGATLPLDFKKVEKVPEGRKRPQEPKRPFPYNEEAVTFENAAAHAKFTGTLTWPRTEGHFPAVLLITGSGQQDRDESILGHRPFLVLSDYLTRHGIAVLRVDDRGVGGSTGDVLHATSEDFASDVLAGLAYLKTRPEIDPHRMGLLGHSEGGYIAPMVARRSPDVAFIVLLAGTGLPGEQISYLQMTAVLKQAGFPGALIAKTLAFQKKLYAAGKQETDPVKFRAKVKQALDEYRGSLTDDELKKAGVAAQSADISARMIGSPWFRFFLTYDPRPALREVRCPVLAVIGEKDIQVPPKENLPEIEKALRAGGNKDFTVKELPHLNHLFQTCQTGGIDEYVRIEETFAPSALELITDWIVKHTR